jgi:fibronectin type 3 domain-containing protein
MNTKFFRILFLMIAIIILGFSDVSAKPITWSTPIELDDGWKNIPQGERISAPGNLNASDGDHDDHINIYWDSVTEASYYELYASDDDDNSYASLLETVYGTSTDDYSGYGGTYYYYWVKACDDSECSDYSNSDLGYIHLDPPTSVSASDGTYTYEVEVSWQLYSRRVSIPVEIWRNDSNNSSGAVYIDTSYGSPYSDSSAEPGKYYYYWVKACGDDFCSEFSYSDDGYMAVEPPTGVSASDGTYTDRVEVEWNLGSVGLYEILRHTSNDPSGAISLATEYGPPFTDWTAEAGTVYHYWVKACGMDVCSELSTSDSGYLLALDYQVFLPLILK